MRKIMYYGREDGIVKVKRDYGREIGNVVDILYCGKYKGLLERRKLWERKGVVSKWRIVGVMWFCGDDMRLWGKGEIVGLIRGYERWRIVGRKK